jgi:hypothetical protein
MKSILMVTGSLIIASALAQENRTPVPKAQSQSAEQSKSTAKSNVEGIINLSDILAESLDLYIANRAGLPLDRTRLAIVDEEGLCKVHHEKLSKVTIPILYGFRPGRGYPKEIEQRLFPNGVTDIDAGCMVMPAKEAIVLQCQQCLEAKSDWIKSQR